MTEHRPKYAGTEVPVCAVCQDWWPCPHAVAVTEPKPTPTAAIEGLRAARQWAHEHGHPQPDDRMLAAYGQVIAAQAAEQARVDQRDQIIADLERRIRSQHLGSTARTWLKYARSVVVFVTDRIARDARRGGAGSGTTGDTP